jgi:hypothetical protein
LNALAIGFDLFHVLKAGGYLKPKRACSASG